MFKTFFFIFFSKHFVRYLEARIYLETLNGNIFGAIASNSTHKGSSFL